jgi:hypothetical protein
MGERWIAATAKGATLGAICLAVVGCLPSAGNGPQRLFTVDEETESIRAQIGPVQFDRYYALPEAERATYRNEYVTARMYAIDLAYNAFEAALTKERQRTGFAATTANLGLTTAATLVSPPGTKDLLTSAATVLTGLKAAYNDDILLAHTIELLQTQMRASRATVSTNIIKGLQAGIAQYPLTAALSDVEAYYQAGTITGALVKLNETVGTTARNAEITKNDVVLSVRFTENEATATISNFLFTAGPMGPINATNQQKLIELIMADGNTPTHAKVLLGAAMSGDQPDLARKLAAAIQKGL